MSDELITLPVAELEKLKERAKKLALDKSYQQLVMQLMNKMGEASGLENVIDAMLRAIVDVIGGANLILYYKIDEAILYADVYGEKKQLTEVDDERVAEAFVTGVAVEYAHDFSDTQMLTPAFTQAYTWIYPLKVSTNIIGVFKMESLHIAMRDLYKQLPLFFNYAALVLKNEILGYSHLQRINEQLQQEIAVRKQTEKALVTAKNDAEAANRAKSVFLANMSHELRTPMNAVLGFSQLLQKDPTLTTSQRESLNIINNSGKHLLLLINEVLDMAKIEAGKMVLENHCFDLGSLLRDTIDMMSERAEAKGLTLLLDQSSSFPRFVISDEAKLKQILLNLIGNAIKYTKTGHITLLLMSEALTNDHYQLHFAVEDTGVGIAEQDLPLVFDTFVQVGKESEHQGSGLGLPIAQKYAQLMGGNISVSSELGKGSVFILSLPVIKRAEQNESVKEAINDYPPICSLAPDQPHYRVLIVEDQLENRLLLKTLLEAVGFEVFEAVNGQEGIEQFILKQPHFIWMDRQMPIMDGITATRKIRELDNGKNVKIVAVTASVFAEQRQEFLAAGADDVIRKPYREAEIFNCMTKHIGVRFNKQLLIPQQAPAQPCLNIKHLPEELLTDLQQAATSLDVEQTMTVIERIKAIDAPLADSLLQSVKQFDFAAIIELL